MQLPLLNLVEIPHHDQFVLYADPLADILPRLGLQPSAQQFALPGERCYTAIWQFNDKGLFLKDVRDLLMEHPITFGPALPQPSAAEWTGSKAEQKLRRWLMTDPTAAKSCRKRPVPAHWVLNPLQLVLNRRGERCYRRYRGDQGYWYRVNPNRIWDEIKVTGAGL